MSDGNGSGNSGLSAESLFAEYFAKLYSAEDLADLARVRTTDANPGQNPAIVAQLAGAAAVFAKLAPEAFAEPGLELDFSDASVHRLGALLTRERRDRWTKVEGSGPPLLVKLVTHGALYVGACVVKNHQGAWRVRRPTWESQVRLSSAAGVSDLAPFHWWLKALSDDEIGKGRLVDRYRTHVEVPTFDAEGLRRIAPADRRLPRLAKPRYSTLYQHLKAHLPELKSLGDDFPSAERFAELAFGWLDFALVGDGRMLVVHGPTEHGVHVFWLDIDGFVKSAYYPADAAPPHTLLLDGDKIRLTTTFEGRSATHETLWWGG